MVSPNRRAILKATAGVGIVGALAGCAEDDPDEPEEDPEEEEIEGEDEPEEPEDEQEELAGVRAAHLSPDAPNVDIAVDDEPVLEDVAFRDVSEYLDLEAGEYDIQVTEAGEDEAVFEETLEIEAEDYTLAALGELADENQPFDVEVFEDDLSDPGEEERVRVIHAAPDAPAVDIVDDESGDPVFEALAFGEAQAGEIPAGDYTLAVQPADGDDDDDPVDTFEVTVEAGVVYTGFAVGYLEPEDAPADEPFDLEVVEDAPADDEDDTAEPDPEDGATDEDDEDDATDENEQDEDENDHEDEDDEDDY